MKQIIFLLSIILLLSSCGEGNGGKQSHSDRFIRIKGVDLVTPDGNKFLIQGINLGNWLNPEGYMFNFGNTSSHYPKGPTALQ